MLLTVSLFICYSYECPRHISVFDAINISGYSMLNCLQLIRRKILDFFFFTTDVNISVVSISFHTKHGAIIYPSVISRYTSKTSMIQLYASNMPAPIFLLVLLIKMLLSALGIFPLPNSKLWSHWRQQLVGRHSFDHNMIIKTQFLFSYNLAQILINIHNWYAMIEKSGLLLEMTFARISKLRRLNGP